MTFDEEFTAYLNKRCDEQGCNNTSTHHASSRTTGKRGDYCNSCMDWDQPCHARDD